MSQPAVVIVGAEGNGLGVARSLTRHQVPVTILGEHLLDPGLFSRGVRAVRLPALRGEPLIEALLTLAREFSAPPMLILTTDDAAQAVSDQRHRLTGAYRFRLPPQEITTALLSKSGIQHWVEACGLPLPKGLYLTSVEQLDQVEAMTYPCVLKPSRRDEVYDARFAKAYRVESAPQMKQLCREILPVFPGMMAQEWIPGGDDNLYFCFQYRADGEARCSFVGRKLRSWPIRVGVTSACVPAPEDAEQLTALTDTLFRCTGVEGFASLEFKRDPRDGRFLVVEPTVGRTNAQEEVAALNGVNLPWLAYAHEFGLPSPPVLLPSPPRLWRDGIADWRSIRANGVARADRFPHEVTRVDAYWRANDPLPALIHLGKRLYAAVWRRLSDKKAG